MRKRFLQDQLQLLDHAEEARTRAEAMTDAASKIRMLGIAEGYEKQARREKTLAGVKFNPKLDVEVTSNSIVITVLGTIYSVTYLCEWVPQDCLQGILRTRTILASR